MKQPAKEIIIMAEHLENNGADSSFTNFGIDNNFLGEGVDGVPLVNNPTMATANLLSDYFPIVIFMVVAFGLAAIILVASRLIVKQKPYSAKNDPYECGFPAFAESRHQFDVRFYLVSILFIIFDLEVAFLFPWVVVLKSVGAFGFYSMMLFLAMLTIGFLYEWKKGALDWE